jgi:hypothetical protein
VPRVAVAPEAGLKGVGDRPSRAPDHNAPPGHTLLDDLQTLVAMKDATRSRSLGSAQWRWASSSRVRYWRPGGRLVEGANRRVETLQVPTADGDGDGELLVGVDLVDAYGGRWPARVLPCT